MDAIRMLAIAASGTLALSLVFVVLERLTNVDVWTTAIRQAKRDLRAVRTWIDCHIRDYHVDFPTQVGINKRWQCVKCHRLGDTLVRVQSQEDRNFEEWKRLMQATRIPQQRGFYDSTLDPISPDFKGW